MQSGERGSSPSPGLDGFPLNEREIGLRTGRGLVFVIAPMRGGTTLLRKVLDSHPAIYSPAETWFLLPLLSMWSGAGSAGVYNPQQAAAALQGHLTIEQFIEASRAFASSFYVQSMPSEATVYVDKTPPYLDIADTIPRVFPDATFIVLVRDPRGTLYSRLTWKHAGDQPIESVIAGVAKHVRTQAAFVRAFGERSRVVSYESLCERPAETAAALCDFLGVPRHDAMTEYGAVAHHEGYGDENSRAHGRPHTGSVRRWEGGLSVGDQTRLAESIGSDDLELLGYAGLSAKIGAGA